MNKRDIPEHVLRFIEDCIDSVPQLEALIMMFEDPQRSWTAADIAARIYTSRVEAARVLAVLTRRGLIESDSAGVSYRICASSDQKSLLIEEVAGTYRSNLVTIATFIHQKAPASVKEFARAFNLKKDP